MKASRVLGMVAVAMLLVAPAVSQACGGYGAVQAVAAYSLPTVAFVPSVTLVQPFVSTVNVQAPVAVQSVAVAAPVYSQSVAAVAVAPYVARQRAVVVQDVVAVHKQAVVVANVHSRGFSGGASAAAVAGGASAASAGGSRGGASAASAGGHGGASAAVAGGASAASSGGRGLFGRSRAVSIQGPFGGSFNRAVSR